MNSTPHGHLSSVWVTAASWLKGNLILSEYSWLISCQMLPFFLFNESDSATPSPPAHLWFPIFFVAYSAFEAKSPRCAVNAAVARNMASAEGQETWSICWFASNTGPASASVFQGLVSWCFVWLCPVFFCFGWSIHTELHSSFSPWTLQMKHYKDIVHESLH